MKKVLFLPLLFLYSVCSGQIVDGVNLAEQKTVEYVEILGINTGVFKKKVVVIVDYGQKIKLYDTDTRVEDADGKSIIFNSMMDAVNQFNGWGWELMFAYPVSEGQVNSVYHYVMRRKKPE